MSQVARIRGPIRTHPSGLMKAARHLPHETLDRQTKSGDLAIERHATWGMSVQRQSSARRHPCTEAPAMQPDRISP
jgi:hypothetical protein